MSLNLQRLQLSYDTSEATVVSVHNSHAWVPSRRRRRAVSLPPPEVMASFVLRKPGLPSRLPDPLFRTSCATGIPIDVLTIAKRFFHSRAITREVAFMLQRPSLSFFGLGTHPVMRK